MEQQTNQAFIDIKLRQAQQILYRDTIAQMIKDVRADPKLTFGEKFKILYNIGCRGQLLDLGGLIHAKEGE